VSIIVAVALRVRHLISALFVVPGLVAAGLFLANEAIFNGHKVMLSGGVPNIWEVPAFPAAPVVLPDLSWASLPARTPDGTVAGLVHDKEQGVFMALDEATGAVRWQVDTGPLPPSFVRADGWRPEESLPAIPLTIAGAGVYMVAWERVWMLVADGGASVKTGTFPGHIPPVSARGGACLVDGGFWIGVEDGRDGGVMLSPAGELADVRSDRPPTCPHLGDHKKVFALSPMQNARANPEPVAPDDPARGYPVKRCGKYSNQTRKHHGNAYCSDMRSDGGPERAVMLHINEPTFRDGDDWLTVTFPISSDGVEFNPTVHGYELAWPRAFFDMAQYRHVTRENNPSPSSFEPKQVEAWTEVVEVVASISRKGELQWVRTMQRGPSAMFSSTFYDNIAYYRSLLLASHPDSPVQNLYIFKPGSLLAVDQASGAPRFQIGTPYPAGGRY
jgi:hypothetical protein